MLMCAIRPGEGESRLLQCADCGLIRPARESDDELIPYGSAPGATCAECGNNGFERVILDSGKSG